MKRYNLAVFLVIMIILPLVFGEQVGIGFIRLDVSDGVFEIDSMWQVAGELKTPQVINIPNSEFYYQLLDDQKQILYTERSDNPFFDVYSYPADDDGNMSTVRLPVDEKQITLRIPLFDLTTELQLIQRSDDSVLWSLEVKPKQFDRQDDKQDVQE